MPPSSLFNAKTKIMFGRWAKYYDSQFFRKLYFERLYRKLLIFLSQFDLSSRPGSFRILDVACGTGELLFRLASIAPSLGYAGVDITPEMLAVARQKLSFNPHIQLIEGDASHLPFKNQAFDLVLCSEAFHHFDKPKKVLNEIARVTRRGGCMVLMDPAANTFFQRLLVRYGARLIEVNHHIYSLAELQAILNEAGYKVEKHFYYFLNNFVLARRT